MKRRSKMIKLIIIIKLKLNKKKVDITSRIFNRTRLLHNPYDEPFYITNNTVVRNKNLVLNSIYPII